MKDPLLQKVELLCARVTKLCTTHPILCNQAIQGLSDFIISLEVSLNHQKQQSNDSRPPPSQQSVRAVSFFNNNDIIIKKITMHLI